MMDQYIATPTNKSVLYDDRSRAGYRLLHAEVDRSERDVLHLQPEPQRRTKQQAVPEQGFPRGIVAGRRPPIADRRRARRAGGAGAALDQAGPIRSTTSSSRPSTPSSIPTRPTRCSTRSCQSAATSNSGSTRKGRRSRSPSSSTSRATVFLDMFQLVIPMFQAVGIDAQIRTMDRSLWETRVRAGARVRCHRPLVRRQRRHRGHARRPLLRADSANALYAPGWQLWYRRPRQPGRDRAAGGDEKAAGALR